MFSWPEVWHNTVIGQPRTDGRTDCRGLPRGGDKKTAPVGAVQVAELVRVLLDPLRTANAIRRNGKIQEILEVSADDATTDKIKVVNRKGQYVQCFISLNGLDSSVELELGVHLVPSARSVSCWVLRAHRGAFPLANTRRTLTGIDGGENPLLLRFASMRREGRIGRVPL